MNDNKSESGSREGKKHKMKKHGGKVEAFIESWPDLCKMTGFIGGYSIIGMKAILNALNNTRLMREYMCEQRYEKYIRKHETLDDFILRFQQQNPDFSYEYYRQLADTFFGKTAENITIGELLRERKTIYQRILCYRQKKSEKNRQLAEKMLMKNKVKIQFLRELRSRKS